VRGVGPIRATDEGRAIKVKSCLQPLRWVNHISRGSTEKESIAVTRFQMVSDPTNGSLWGLVLRRH
jgi:hypothetical protein